MRGTNLWNLFHLYGHKIIGLVLISFLLPLLAEAQMNLPNHDRKKIHFGIGFGLNSSKFQVVHSEEFTQHDSIKVVESPWSPGFNLGIISNLHLTKRLDLRFIPTLIFAEKDLSYTEIRESSDTTFTRTIESIYIDFPLTFKYKSDRIFDNFRFYALAGIRFDWDLASNSKKRKAVVVKVDQFDIVAEYGLGLEFYFPLFILSPEIKLTYGIPNVFVDTPDFQYSNVLDRLRSRSIMFTLQFEG